jgi:hypothetical protein
MLFMISVDGVKEKAGSTITRRVLDVLLAMPERHRFTRGIIASIGGKQVPTMYDRSSRHKSVFQ